MWFLWMLLVASYYWVDADAFSPTTSGLSLRLPSPFQVHSSLEGQSCAFVPIKSREQLLQQVHFHESNSSNHNATTNNKLCLVKGYILQRRPLGRSLVFLNVVPDHKNPENYVETLLQRQDFVGETNGTFDAYHAILQPGTHVTLSGEARPHKKDSAIPVVHRACYMKPNANPQHLRKALQLVQQSHFLPMKEIARALEMTTHDLTTMLSANATNSAPTLDELYEISKTILAGLSDLIEPSKLAGSGSRGKQKSLLQAPAELTCPPDNRFDEIDRTTTVAGVVQNRIRYRGNITELDLLLETYNEASFTDDENRRPQRQTCVLHPSMLSSFGNKKNDTVKSQLRTWIYSTLAAPGALMEVRGVEQPRHSSTNQTVLWVTQTPRLLRSCSWPRTVRFAVESTHAGLLEAEEASEALNIPLNDVWNIQQEADVTKRQWIAAEIARNLENSKNQSRLVTDEMRELLESYSILRKMFPVVEKWDTAESHSVVLYNKFIDSIRESTTGSRWKQAKVPQLLWMLERIGEILNQRKYKEGDKLEIVDVGGGKGYLAGLVAQVFSENRVNVRVIDICERATWNGMMYAKRRDLNNIKFHAADTTNIDLGHVDLVIALHACGALSDVALAHAVHHRASFVICPCCFRSNGFLRIRSSEGTIQTPAEWLGLTESSLGSIQRAAEIQGDRATSALAIHTLCAIRAQAVWNHSAKAFPNGTIHVSIQSFPIGFSSRNFCLVGEMMGKVQQ